MNSIIKRKVFWIKVKFTSPLNISSGNDEWTDADVLKNFDGKPFIPGSSLAGAMRAYLCKKKTTPCLMGYSENDGNGKMSSLFISDLDFDDNYVFGIRDGVALDQNKIAVDGSKFDLEIMEAMATGHFSMELVVRETDNENEMNLELARIFNAIQKSELRLGCKKTRGFGKFEIIGWKQKEYTANNYKEYAEAYSNFEISDLEKENSLKDLDDFIATAGLSENDGKMIRLEVPLQIRGGISIRQYAAKKGEPDFVQLMDHGKAVIPGSSLAGAIRHRIELILNSLKEENTSNIFNEIPEDRIMNTIFGYVTDDAAQASNVIISEAVIEGAKPLTMVRTGVSRFESAVKDGALYKEKTYVGGSTTLEILIRQQEEQDINDLSLGLILVAIKDLQTGLLAVGGQTAIGRGIFSGTDSILLNGEELAEEKVTELIQNSFKQLQKCGGL